MNKLSLVVLLAVAVCSCYGISDRRSTRSASEVSAESNPIVSNVAAPQDLDAAKSADVFTGRGKNNKGGGGNKHKMEVMHMGLSYIKMVISTLMAIIGHIFAFKSVGLALISVFIQVAQFIMTLKKSKEGSHGGPPPYKVVETPWHTSPTESFGSYGSYGGGHGKASSSDGYYNNASPYANPSSRSGSRR